MVPNTKFCNNRVEKIYVNVNAYFQKDLGSISPPFLRAAFKRAGPKKRKKYSQVVSYFLHFWDLGV